MLNVECESYYVNFRMLNLTQSQAMCYLSVALHQICGCAVFSLSSELIYNWYGVEDASAKMHTIDDARRIVRIISFPFRKHINNSTTRTQTAGEQKKEKKRWINICTIDGCTFWRAAQRICVHVCVCVFQLLANKRKTNTQNNYANFFLFYFFHLFAFPFSAMVHSLSSFSSIDYDLWLFVMLLLCIRWMVRSAVGGRCRWEGEKRKKRMFNQRWRRRTNIISTGWWGVGGHMWTLNAGCK